jgi:ferritin-like metal-binding protein YciE
MKKQDMTIEELYIHELQDTYSAETQSTKALPKVIEACQSPELVEALKTHLEETKTQIKRLEQVFANHGEEASGNHCEGMEGLVKEGDEAIKEIAKGPVRDAALIAGCQRSSITRSAPTGRCARSPNNADSPTTSKSFAPSRTRNTTPTRF